MEWKTSQNLIPYEDAIAFMDARVRAIREEKADELVWLLEHPALYTAGTSANESDLMDTLGFPVHQSGRGGQYTYHGPGQRVAYVMLDLKKRGADVRLHVQKLEIWVITTLADFGVEGFIRQGRVGVWVNAKNVGKEQEACALESPEASGSSLKSADRSGNGYKEAKIAAIGVRIRQWVSFHGIALNVNPDLSHYRGIVPCGIREYGVTSLAALGVKADMRDVDAALRESFGKVF